MQANVGMSMAVGGRVRQRVIRAPRVIKATLDTVMFRSTDQRRVGVRRLLTTLLLREAGKPTRRIELGIRRRRMFTPMGSG
jgi:hypothetical protein